MLDAVPDRDYGTSPACYLPNLTERSEPGFEETLMGKKFSRRSLQDDAFSA
jgi:RNA polymerase primary sigma factor